MAIIEAKTTFGRIAIMLILCAIGFLFAPLLLLIGRWRLKRMDPDDPEYKVLKYVLIGGTVLVVGGILWLIWRYTPRDGENVNELPGLPDTAANICYYRWPFNYDVYEFDFTEEKFRELYAQENPEEITEKDPVKMDRYGKFTGGKPEEEQSIVIRSGLHVKEKEFTSDGLGFTYVREIAFDREKKRVYFISKRKE